MGNKTSFKPGHAKVGGNVAGTPHKRTVQIRAGLVDAIELLRGGKSNPIVFQQELNALLRRVAILRATGKGERAEETMDTVAAAIAKLPVSQARLVLDFLVAARDGWYKLTQFAYPKLSQIDVKDALSLGLMTAAADGNARVEYTRRIIVEPNGNSYEHSPVRAIEHGPAGDGGRR